MRGRSSRCDHKTVREHATAADSSPHKICGAANSESETGLANDDSHMPEAHWHWHLPPLSHLHLFSLALPEQAALLVVRWQPLTGMSYSASVFPPGRALAKSSLTPPVAGADFVCAFVVTYFTFLRAKERKTTNEVELRVERWKAHTVCERAQSLLDTWAADG